MRSSCREIVRLIWCDAVGLPGTERGFPWVSSRPRTVIYERTASKIVLDKFIAGMVKKRLSSDVSAIENAILVKKPSSSEVEEAAER